MTLEPCSHHGRTGPCADALIAAGVARVVVAVADPDPQVAGAGLARLEAAGVAVEVGCRADEVADQLAPYLHHRRTGRPLVVLKLAATLDGRTAAADGTSQWITGVEARTDAHRLRAESQAVVVGAGTVAADDPTLTTRLVDGPDPTRVVLGRAPAGAAVHPCTEWTRDDGDLGALLDRLGADGVLQVLVEGGRHRGHRLPPGRPGRPLRALPGPRPGRRRRRRRPLPGPGPGHHHRPLAGSHHRGQPGGRRPPGRPVTRPRAGSRLMFTGIVEELGTVAGREGHRLRIAADVVTSDAGMGDSIAVNGTCLTVVALGEGWWEADVVDETLSRTSLGALAPGDPVNLERPVRVQDRLGGHLVQGHVDGVGHVVTPAPDLRVTVPDGLLRYVVEKGSITIDGVSLTVAAVHDDGLSVALIPHTTEVTTLGRRGPGDAVNLEVDVTAKHVERLLAWYADHPSPEAAP